MEFTGIKFDTWQPEWLEKAIVFAEKAYDPNYETPRERQLQQNWLAKLAEVAVHRVFGTTYPDFKIYEGHRKSWKPDLFLNNYSIHVKSQETQIATRCESSWLFQNDKSQGRIDDVIKAANVNDLTALVMMDAEKLGAPPKAIIMGLLSIPDVAPFFSDPKLRKWVGKKKALYYKHIRKLPLWHLGIPEQHTLKKFRL